MNSMVNLSLYNQIKNKFSVSKGTIVFISLNLESIDNLEHRVFTKDSYSQYRPLLNEHLRNSAPYAVFDYLDEIPTFYLACKEFGREEDLTNGQVIFFELNPFEIPKVDMAKLKAELAQLGQSLLGNSKAS